MLYYIYMEQAQRTLIKNFALLRFSHNFVREIENIESHEIVFKKNYAFTIFATRNSIPAESERNVRMINELVVPFLCEQAGLEPLQYFPFDTHLKGFDYDEVPCKFSLFSKNMLKKDEKLSCFFSSSIRKNEKILKLEYEDRGYAVDYQDIEEQCFRLMILDILTLQIDRHGQNLPIVINDKEKTVRFGKVFDNELSFAVSLLKNQNKDIIQTLMNGGKLDLDKTIQIYNKEMTNFRYCLSFEEGQQSDKNISNRIKNCVEFANSDPRMMEILQEVLASVNVNTAFKDLKNLGATVSDEYQSFCQQVADFGKKAFASELQSSNPLYDKSSSSTHPDAKEFLH